MNPAILDLRDEKIPVFSLSGLAVLIFFLVENLVHDLRLYAVIDAALLAGVVASYLLFKFTPAGKRASGLGLAMIMTGLLLQLHGAGMQASIWVLVFPIPVFNILGQKPGRIFLAVWWSIVGLYVLLGPAAASLSTGLKVEIMLCFLVSCVLSHQQERIRVKQVLRMNDLRREAQAANRSKDRFLAQVTHELRTPLNAVLGFSQILEERETLQDADRQLVEKIHSAGDSLLALVNRVLDFSRLDAGMMTYRPSRFPLADLVDEVLLMAEPQALQRGLSVRRDCGGGTVVEADRELLRLALTNLLSNAVKFTPAGGEIRVFGRREDGLVLGVSDTGTGIPAAAAATLFEPFVQLDNALEMGAKGTGLGLSIVKMVADLHGAEVGVESRPGVGSTFTLRLPASMLVADDRHAGTPAAAPAVPV